MAQKRGLALGGAPTQQPVWIHAVSVGESVAALALARRIAAPVVLTTATPASAQRVAAEAPDHVVHRYGPLDSLIFVRRFLRWANPRAAFFVEGEIWPATVFALRRRGIPLALVSADLSQRTFASWSRRRALARTLFGAVPRVLAQSDAAAERFTALGAPRVEVTGQLKFDAPPPRADEEQLAALRAAVGQRPLWLAASTHQGEDEAVIAAHGRLRERIGDALLILAPRHPERGARVAALAGDAPRRSAGALPAPEDAIYVADTLGEMGTFFALSQIVFLGASLVPLGGHNPAEPAAFGAALLTGPSHGTMFEPFLCAGAATVATGDTLADSLAVLIGDEAARHRAGRAARAVLERERGAAQRTLGALADWVPSV